MTAIPIGSKPQGAPEPSQPVAKSKPAVGFADVLARGETLQAAAQQRAVGFAETGLFNWNKQSLSAPRPARGEASERASTRTAPDRAQATAPVLDGSEPETIKPGATVTPRSPRAAASFPNLTASETPSSALALGEGAPEAPLSPGRTGGRTHTLRAQARQALPQPSGDQGDRLVVRHENGRVVIQVAAQAAAAQTQQLRASLARTAAQHGYGAVEVTINGETGHAPLTQLGVSNASRSR